MNDLKILEKNEKRDQVVAQLGENFSGDVLEKLTKKLDKALLSGGIPDYFYQEQSYLLCRAIQDSYCRDRPFAPPAYRKEWVDDMNNIHLMC